MTRHDLTLVPDIAEMPRLIDWVQARCGETGLGSDVAFKLALALEEAAVNVIEHGFDGIPPPHRIEIGLDIGDAVVTAEIIDNGRPFDPQAAAAPDLSQKLSERSPGGLGIHLIRTMMDKVEYRHADGRNRLRLELKR